MIGEPAQTTRGWRRLRFPTARCGGRVPQQIEPDAVEIERIVKPRLGRRSGANRALEALKVGREKPINFK
jgi:hypothetical protein